MATLYLPSSRLGIFGDEDTSHRIIFMRRYVDYGVDGDDAADAIFKVISPEQLQETTEDRAESRHGELGTKSMPMHIGASRAEPTSSSHQRHTIQPHRAPDHAPLL